MLLMSEAAGCPPEGTSGQWLGGRRRCTGERHPAGQAHGNMYDREMQILSKHLLRGRVHLLELLSRREEEVIGSRPLGKRCWVESGLGNETRQLKGKIGIGEIWSSTN